MLKVKGLFAVQSFTHTRWNTHMGFLHNVCLQKYCHKTIQLLNVNLLHYTSIYDDDNDDDDSDDDNYDEMSIVLPHFEWWF